MQISVVIPTRNRAPKLRRTLEALHAQSASPDAFEVIVVDNGSTDDTCVVVTAYLERAGRPSWKYLRESRPGAAAARNAGVQASQGEIILFLDDDVVADPPLIEEHRQRQLGQSAIVLGSVRFPWDGTGTPFRQTLFNHPELLQSFRFPDPNDVPFQHFYTCNVSLPRAFLARSGAFDEAFQASGFEDIDLGYRLSRCGFRTIFNAKASAAHDCWQPFAEFAEKQQRNGRELRLLLQKHPELREIFLPRKRLPAALAGGLAALLAPSYDCQSVLSPILLPVLSRLCWLNLQLRFRHGFEETA